MASITNGQMAAKLAIQELGISLTHSDYASLANAVHCGGPKADVRWCTKYYFYRNHREYELTDEQFDNIGHAVYVGLWGHRQPE